MFMPVCWAAPTTWFCPSVVILVYLNLFCSAQDTQKVLSSVFWVLSPDHEGGLDLSVLGLLPGHAGGLELNVLGPFPRSWRWPWSQCPGSSHQIMGVVLISGISRWSWSWTCRWSWSQTCWSQCTGSSPQDMWLVLISDMLISVYWVLSSGHVDGLDLSVQGPVPGHTGGLEFSVQSSVPRTWGWSWAQLSVLLGHLQGHLQGHGLSSTFAFALWVPVQDHGMWCWPGPCAWCVLSPRLVVLIGKRSHLIAIVMTWGAVIVFRYQNSTPSTGLLCLCTGNSSRYRRWQLFCWWISAWYVIVYNYMYVVGV